MELNIAVLGEESVTDKITVSDVSFTREFNEPLIHQVVTAYLAGGRSGNHAQKTRSEVRGGGRKPWRQKGSGRARAGTIRSPLWRSGGIIFAKSPRDYSQKVNKKMYRAAIASILSELIRQERMIVVKDFQTDAPKTKILKEQLRFLQAKNILIVSESIDNNLYLAARNLPNVDVRDVEGADPVSLVKFEKIIITVSAIRKLEERLG